MAGCGSPRCGSPRHLGLESFEGASLRADAAVGRLAGAACGGLLSDERGGAARASSDHSSASASQTARFSTWRAEAQGI